MSQKSWHFYQCKQCRASSARTFEKDFIMLCRLKREEWENGTFYCTSANLFGVGYEYDVQKDALILNWRNGIHWDSFMGVMASMKKIEMKIRPKNYDKNGIISICIQQLTIQKTFFFL